MSQCRAYRGAEEDIGSPKLESQAVVSHHMGAEPFLQPQKCSPSGKLSELQCYSCLECEFEERATVAIFRAGCNREEVTCWKWKPGNGSARSCLELPTRDFFNPTEPPLPGAAQRPQAERASPRSSHWGPDSFPVFLGQIHKCPRRGKSRCPPLAWRSS